MLAMAQFFFRQQTKRHDDQTATGICSQRRINAKEKPVCYGYEEDAQSARSQHKNAKNNVRSTHTETIEAKTGLVHVTSARRAVMETGNFVSV